MSHTLEVHKQFQPSGEWAAVHLQDKAKNVSSWAQAIVPLENVVSSERVQLHLFCSRVIQELQFSETSKTIFERYQSDVDKVLVAKSVIAFEKLPHVFERLQNGEPEAVSHALTSCRRIIDAFADSIFPHRAVPVMVGSKELDCGSGKTKNKIRAYVAKNIASDSRRERINRNLNALYDRVSAGVHSDVSTEEAQALVLNTYLLLGEIATLEREKQK